MSPMERAKNKRTIAQMALMQAGAIWRPTPRDWRDLLRGETKQLDYKGPVSWSDAKADLAKDIIAMSNIRDGGQIVIGVSENATTGGHEAEALSPEQLSSFDPTDIVQYVNGFVQPGVRLQVVREAIEAKPIIRLEVAEFDHAPNVCTKPGPKNSFYSGQILIRTDAAQTRVIQTAEEMRELLRLALAKTSEGLLRDMRSIIEGRGSSEGPAPETHAEDLDEWARECEAFAVRTNTAHKKDVGTFSCSMVPTSDIVAIDDYDILRRFVFSSSVNRPGDRFPHSQYGSYLNRGSFLEGINEVPGYENEWGAFKAGPFGYVEILAEDDFDLGREGAPDGRYLLFTRACAKVAFVFMFAQRFYEQREYSGELEFTFRWAGMKGRRLRTGDMWWTATHLECHENEVADVVRLTWTDLKTAWERAAIAVLDRLFDIFQVSPRRTGAIEAELRKIRGAG